jgi:hypothetical protein
MSAKPRKPSPDGKKRLTSSKAALSSRKEAEILRLKAELQGMKDEQVKYISTFVEWKEQITRLRARLEQMDRLLLPFIEAPPMEKKKRRPSFHRHHERHGLLSDGGQPW